MNPNSIAMRTQRDELMTEAKLFIAQSQGIAPAFALPANEIPLGNGRPMRKPGGKSIANVSSTRIKNGVPRVNENMVGSETLSSTIEADKTRIATPSLLYESRMIFFDRRLPIPENTRSEKRTSDRE